MSKDLDLALEISTSDCVVASAQFANQYLNKWLHFHQTKWVTKFGTNSDGHGRITHAQIFSGALREAYGFAKSIEDHANNARRAYGQELKAKATLEKELTEWDRIDAECDLRAAIAAQEASRIQAESIKYQLDATMEVIAELKEIVTNRYESFEASEQDNWTETAKYWIKQQRAGAQKDLTTLPLPPVMKAKIGVMNKKNEMTLWLQGLNPEVLETLCKNDPQELLRLIENQNKPKLEAVSEQPSA